MKHVIEWLAVTAMFIIGTWLSNLMFGATYPTHTYVMGLSIGYGLCLLKSIDDKKR